MKNNSAVVYVRYLEPSVSDLIFSWCSFDPLWAPIGVLGFPLRTGWVPFGTLLGFLGSQMEALGALWSALCLLSSSF